MRPVFVLLAALALSQTACVSLYVPALEQGNVLTASAVNQVQLGMTRRQVQFVLGTPLIADPFHRDRWDYYYRYIPHSQKGAPHKEHLMVLFKDDKVIKLVHTGIPSAKVANTKTN